MGYQVYKVGPRYGGYGVPTVCEHPKCDEKIDRGISYACGSEPFSEQGCDRYFCGKHRDLVGFDGEGKKCRHKNDCECEYIEICERCSKGKSPFPYKPETKEWAEHLLTDESWKEWRDKNPKEVSFFESLINVTK